MIYTQSGKLNENWLLLRPKLIDMIKKKGLASSIDGECTFSGLLHFNDLGESWAKIKGTVYKPGTILVHDVSGDCDDFDVSLKTVSKVFVYNEDRIIFECTLLSTVDFDYHFNCFEVEYPEIKRTEYIFHDSLLSHVPNHINIARMVRIM